MEHIADSTKSGCILSRLPVRQIERARLCGRNMRHCANDAVLQMAKRLHLIRGRTETACDGDPNSIRSLLAAMRALSRRRSGLEEENMLVAATERATVLVKDSEILQFGGRVFKNAYEEKRSLPLKCITYRQIPAYAHVVQVAAFDQNVWGLCANGNLLCLDGGVDGENWCLCSLDILKLPGGQQRIVQIPSCTGGHYGIVCASGDVYMFGSGKFGRLGNGTEGVGTSTGCKLPIPDKAVEIRLGVYHTVVLTETGDVYTFGRGFNGQLGLEGSECEDRLYGPAEAFRDQSVPCRVQRVFSEHGVGTPLGTTAGVSLTVPVRAVCIAAADHNTVIVTGDGLVYGTGYGGMGRRIPAGVDSSHVDASNSKESNYRFQRIKGELHDKRIVTVSGGSAHFVAMDSEGLVYTWGEGVNGQLGHGTCVSVMQPKTVMSLAGEHAVDVQAGPHYTVVLTERTVCETQQSPSGHDMSPPLCGNGDRRGRSMVDRAMWTFGLGVGGRLGHGFVKDEMWPRQVPFYV